MSGVECVIVANDATVKGGTYYPMTVKKHLRAQQIALDNHLPCIYLVDSGGAFLPMQDEVFPDADDFGRIFYHQAIMSAAGIPQISAVMGSCTAGGAYVPAMSDELVIVNKTGTFLGGPPLVKAATGEEVSAEDLGGAYVHTHISGVADHFAEDDAHALDILRDIVATLTVLPQTPRRSSCAPHPLFYHRGSFVRHYSRDFPRNLRRPRTDRAARWQPLPRVQGRYGTTLVTGFAAIEGYPVGIIANNGVLFSELAAQRDAFHRTVRARANPAPVPAKHHRLHGGPPRTKRAGSPKMARSWFTAVAVAQARSSRSSSAGALARAITPCAAAPTPRDSSWLWPNARITVMGGEQAANVLATVKRGQLEGRGAAVGRRQRRSF